MYACAHTGMHGMDGWLAARTDGPARARVHACLATLASTGDPRIPLGPLYIGSDRIGVP